MYVNVLFCQCLRACKPVRVRCLTIGTTAYIIGKMPIPKIEVQSLLHELWSIAGLSDAEIGAAVGAPGQTINRLRNAAHKTTSIERGIKIANFHASVFSKSETTAAQ